MTFSTIQTKYFLSTSAQHILFHHFHLFSPSRWTGTMAKQLQTQKEFLQALQAPIAYHNKLLKEL